MFQSFRNSPIAEEEVPKTDAVPNFPEKMENVLFSGPFCSKEHPRCDCKNIESNKAMIQHAK
jgi:hypothetical protein